MLKLNEEVKPRPKPATCELYNSPPSFEGRYRLANDGERPIQSDDFAFLKSRNWIYYLSEEYLEEMDMFTESPGWRLTGEAVNYLAQKNYVVDILTLEAQEARKAERAEKRKLEQLSRTKNEADYRAEVADFDALMNCSFHEQRNAEYVGDTIVRISNKNDELSQYTEYSLLSSNANHIFKFTKHDSDSWMSQVSDETPRNISELQRLAADVKQK